MSMFRKNGSHITIIYVVLRSFAEEVIQEKRLSHLQKMQDPFDKSNKFLSLDDSANEAQNV